MRLRYIYVFKEPVFGEQLDAVEATLRAIGMTTRGWSDSSWGDWCDFTGEGMELRLLRNWDPLDDARYYPVGNADDLVVEFETDDEQTCAVDLVAFVEENFKVERFEKAELAPLPDWANENMKKSSE